MVKQINYYQCDCERGKLEVIAKTQYKEGRCSAHDAYTPEGWPMTLFLKCDRCNMVYTAPATGSVGNPINGITHERNIQPYRGRLSEHQIRRYIPQINGEFKEEDEERILEQ